MEKKPEFHVLMTGNVSQGKTCFLCVEHIRALLDNRELCREQGLDDLQKLEEEIRRMEAVIGIKVSPEEREELRRRAAGTYENHEDHDARR